MFGTSRTQPKPSIPADAKQPPMTPLAPSDWKHVAGGPVGNPTS
jgi:hypothetical protein